MACEQVVVRVTVSIGIAHSTGDESIEATIDRADKALYTAKNEGRNRIVSEPRIGRGEAGAVLPRLRVALP